MEESGTLSLDLRVISDKNSTIGKQQVIMDYLKGNVLSDQNFRCFKIN